jgi:hypothetical protein
MPSAIKRLVAGIGALALVFALAGCDSEQDPTGTTPPGETVTTSPVGS